MPDYRNIEKHLTSALGLTRRPVAIALLDTAPADVAAFTGTVPSGCSFWRLASDGRVFYTKPSDHYNCPVGSYTHHIDLPDSRAQELMGTLGLMTEIGYIKMEEVSGILRLPKTPNLILYAPLGDTPVSPDVVIFSGQAGRVMLLAEAATRAGVGSQLPLLGRPTCMSIPAAVATGLVSSTSCIGNRVYTEIGDGELYITVRGADIERLSAEAPTIADANGKLLEYHQGRKQQLLQSHA